MIVTSPLRFVIPAVLGLLCLTAETAAQPGGYAPAAPGQPASAAPAPLQKWGVGLRLASQAMSSTVNEDDTVEMGGGGLHARYRWNHRWELELSVVGTSSGERDTDIERTSSALGLGALFHMRPGHRWDWYLLAGVGTTRDTVRYTKAASDTPEEFQSTHVYFGAGVERRFRRFGLAAELRMIGSRRDDEALDGANYAPGVDGPIPAESSGAQLSLMATYYF